MAVDIRMRQRIDKLLGIYCGYLEQHSAGWPGISPLQLLVEFRGDMPRASGCDQSNTSMINAVSRLQRQHAHLKLAFTLLGQVRMCGCQNPAICKRCNGYGVYLADGRITPKNALALLCERLNREGDRTAIAAALHLNRRQLEGRIARGREEMADQLTFFDEAAEIGRLMASA